MYIDVAQCFQKAGITALVYDPRGVGTSEGEPRGEIDPAKQTQDFLDAITFIKTKSIVDPRRIALWGYSLSAAEVLAAAAVDKRVKAVVAVCPASNPFDPQDPTRRRRILVQAIRDRESRARGNPPFELPYIGESEDSIFNFRFVRGMTKLPYEAVMSGLAAIPNFRNLITVQTFLNLAMWEIQHLLPLVSPIPVLQLQAEQEELQHIAEGYENIYNALGEPKERHIEADRGHMDILTNDERFPAIMKLQVDFILKHLED